MFKSIKGWFKKKPTIVKLPKIRTQELSYYSSGSISLEYVAPETKALLGLLDGELAESQPDVVTENQEYLKERAKIPKMEFHPRPARKLANMFEEKVNEPWSEAEDINEGIAERDVLTRAIMSRPRVGNPDALAEKKAIDRARMTSREPSHFSPKMAKKHDICVSSSNTPEKT